VEVLDRQEAPVVSNNTRPAIMEDELLAFTPDEIAKFIADPDGDPLHLELISNVVGGEIITRNGFYTFRPDTEFSGRASFDYRAGDNRGGHVNGHLEFDILPVNDPVDTGLDSFTTPEDTPLVTTVGNLLANDTDVDGRSIEFVGLGGAEHGSVRLEGEQIIFTPDPDYNGNDAFFTYSVKDDRGLESTGKVHIEINGTNDAPRVAETELKLTEDQPVTLDNILLASCFKDIDGDTLTVTGAEALSGGTVTSRGNRFIFTPDPDYHGPGSLRVTVTDGHESVTNTLSLDIQAVDNPAQCGTDQLRTLEEQSVSTSVTEIMTNDRDPDGELSFAGLENAVHGSVRLEGERITFTPDLDYFGEQAGFTYLVRDTEGNMGRGRVTVQVENVDDVPEIIGNHLHLREDQVFTFTEGEMAKFIHDPDPHPLRLAGVSNVTGGRMEYGNGLYTFTPDQNFYGRASFDYVARNGLGEELSGRMNIDILPENDLPETTLHSLSTVEDHEVTIDTATLLAGATDVEDGNRLRFGSVDSSLHGDVYMDKQNILHFLPDRDFFGIGAFSYTVLDSEGGLTRGYVTVDISGENDAPQAVDDRGIFAWSNNGYENIFHPNTFLANDKDVDHDTLRISGVSNAEHGTVFQDSNGRIHYTAPANGWVGIDSFTYTVNDGHGGISKARAELGVRLNSSPDLLSELLLTREDTTSLINPAELLANDHDIDGDALKIIGVDHGEHCSVTLLPDGSIRFVPELNYNNNYPGQASFQYTVSDGVSTPVSCTAFFDIEPVNDKPVLTGERLIGAVEDNIFSFNVAQLMANDTDIEMASSHETDSISFAGLGGAAHGRISLGTGGEINYIPDANFYGTDSFYYSVIDSHGLRSTVQSQIAVRPVNDLPVVEYDYSSGAEDSIWNSFSISRLLANDSDIDGDTLSIRSPHVISGHGRVRISGSSLQVRPDAGQHDMIIGYTVTDGHGGEVESRLNLENIRMHNYAPTFSGIYRVTRYDPLSGIIFSFHAEDRNGGDSWTMAGGQHRMGDIASITAANLHTDYPLAGLTDYGYGHFGLRWHIVRPGGGAGDNWDPSQLGYNATFTLTVTDHQGATGTIFVDLDRMQKNVGPVYHYTPVVLDLDGDGVELLDASEGVRFDWNLDGRAEATGWVGHDDGFLVYDYDHDRQVNRPDELALRQYSPGASTDLEGLQAFDSNDDGRFDKNDANWNDFGVWQDRNSNGITDTGEFSSLDELGIVAVNLESNEQYEEVNGNVVYGTTSFVREDETTGEVADVGLNGAVVEETEDKSDPSSPLPILSSQEQNGSIETAAETTSPETEIETEEQNISPAEPAPLDDVTINQLTAQLVSDMATSPQTVDTPQIHAPLPMEPVITVDHHDLPNIHDQEHDILAMIS
jgi:hypothetical protein